MLALIDSPYARTPDAVYSVYYHVKAAVPSTRYGGAYVRKPGFHASVEDNLASWPSNYSIREEINRRAPRTVTRALDLTLSDADMRKLTKRLADAAAADDPRLAGLREFFGTLDGRTVYGLARRGPGTPWYAASADSSHLWHIHLSFFTPYADNWAVLTGLASVLRGESLDDYLGGTMAERNLAEYGDSGTWVGFFQRYLAAAGAKVTVDNRYGDETTAAAKWWFTTIAKGTGSYSGRYISSWIARELIRREAQAIAKAAADAVKPPPAPAPTQAQVDAAVAKYLDANPVRVPSGVRVNLGTVNGTLTDG